MTCVLYEAKPTAGAYLPCKPAVRVGARLYSSATLERKGMRVLCPHNANPEAPGRGVPGPAEPLSADPDVYCVVRRDGARGDRKMCPGAILKPFFYDRRVTLSAYAIPSTRPRGRAHPPYKLISLLRSPRAAFITGFVDRVFAKITLAPCLLGHVHATIATGTWPPVPSSRSTGTQPVPSSGARRHTEAP